MIPKHKGRQVLIDSYYRAFSDSQAIEYSLSQIETIEKEKLFANNFFTKLQHDEQHTYRVKQRLHKSLIWHKI